MKGMEAWEYVEMDNMPVISCQLLNIMWAENRGLTIDELTQELNTNFPGEWQKQDVIMFLRQLLIGDYAEKKRKGLKVYYMALGCEEEL